MRIDIALLLVLVGTIITAGVLLKLRPKDVYKIKRRQWIQVLAETHLLTFEPEGWVLVPLAESTEDDVQEHVFHMQHGTKAAIEEHMANMDKRESQQHQQTPEQAELVMERTRALFAGEPLPGEDDPSEAVYAQLQRDYGKFPRANTEWRRTLFMHAVPRPEAVEPEEE